jgi:1,5-anhydro-D-fructose reductase (1,5-anhydro-D-mannitol-forming)
MTQQPKGDVVLINDEGSRKLILEHVNLYETGVRDFSEAVAGRSQPAASGGDGLWSLATSVAVVEAAKTGKATPVILE